MAHKRKNPVGDRTPDGGGRNFLTGKQAASNQKAPAGQAAANRRNPSDTDAIWEACREAMDAAASRKAGDAARATAAALALGRFKQNESEQWVYQCPDCRQTLALGINVNGDVRASSSGQKTCPIVPELQQWLRDNCFQS
jgi:hypothetical protein